MSQLSYKIDVNQFERLRKMYLEINAALPENTFVLVSNILLVIARILIAIKLY